MIVLVKIANFLAKHSCSKWNSFRPTRIVCRKLYRALADIPFIDCGPYESCGNISNTYPWPYRDKRFAAWPEEKDALVSDSSNMVVRHATSYCAWKIRETIKWWPNIPIIPKSQEHAAEIAKRERPHDAKYWCEFLESQGAWRAATLCDGQRYVGVNPNYGEYGLVVWFERLVDNDSTRALVSTYLRGAFCCRNVTIGDFTWYEID